MKKTPVLLLCSALLAFVAQAPISELAKEHRAIAELLMAGKEKREELAHE